MGFLGLDIGTSAIKAALVDENESELAVASAPLSTSRPHALWSEQDPKDWWDGLCLVIAELKAAAPQSWGRTDAIGLSGQMHGLVLLDENRNVIRPAMLWNDGRASHEAQALEREMPAIGQIAGVKPMAGFAAPKLRWVERHEPDNFKRIAMILSAKDYIRYRLTGEFATDMCDASGSLWLDVADRRWSIPIVEASGLKLAQLPRLLEGNDISGTLDAHIAHDWGLDFNPPVAAGAGDVAAGAIGIGAINDGDAFVSIGTSAQYFVAREAYLPIPGKFIHAFCHGLPGRWSQIAALLNGASCLSWAASLLGTSDIAALLGETEAAFDGPSDLLFLPYLTGERTPYNNPHAKGVLFGLTPGVARSDIVLAVLEGVALSLADCQQILEQAGTQVDELGLIGGGTRSTMWMRILASILNRPLKIYAGSESGPALGAARLARLAVTGESIRNVCRAPQVRQRVEPEAKLVAAYSGRLAAFRELYRSLVPEFVGARSDWRPPDEPSALQPMI